MSDDCVYTEGDMAFEKAQRDQEIARLKALLLKTAEGLLDDAIQAVEYEDIDDVGSWCTVRDNWESNASNAVDIVRQISTPDWSWETWVNERRANLEEDRGERHTEDCPSCDGAGCENCSTLGEVFICVV